MARIVMKFGGTSVADIDRIRNVARHVKREVDAGHEVAVVVSAMSGKTNELVGWVREASKAEGANFNIYDAREYDTVVASGEQVTSGLLALVLQAMGVHARSWQGWQIPIRTDGAHGAARIDDIDAALMIERIPDARDLVALLQESPLPAAIWTEIGRVIARLHRAGIWHADLNAHNILLDVREQVWLIDFDKCRERSPGRWQQANLARLQRSLHKEAGLHAQWHLQDTDIAHLLDGYRRASSV